MRESLRIEEKHRKLFSFVDEKRPFESVSEYFGIKLGKDQRVRSQVVKGVLCDPELGDIPVYFKLYGYRKLRRGLSRMMKQTRSKGEFANLNFFHKLGIPACEPIARGEYRNVLGIPRNCMIITREITGAKQLDHFIRDLEADSLPDDIKMGIRRQIIESLAAGARKIHSENFYHDDLKWRNILVRHSAGDDHTVEVFWIDCPNGYFDQTGGLRKKHGVIKDVATLDHLAWRNCSEEERKYFISCYLGCSMESAELAEFANDVVEYRKLKLDD